MRDFPTLGERRRKSHTGSVLALMLLGAAGASGLWWWKHRTLAGIPFANHAPASQTQAAEPLKPAAPEPARAAPTPKEILKRSGVQFLSVSIDGPLERSLVGQTGKELGQALAQVVTRTLVWWVNVPGDLRKGDRVDVLFEERPTEEPIIHAIRFASGKSAKTFRAYRYKPAAAPFARLYDSSGDEVETRLRDAPLDDYEQVTSFLKDGRKHKGVDFKTPVGSKVRATFDGTITKRNWNFRGNGNCLEVTESGGQGRKALFLHLSEVPKTVQVGMHVAKGEAIAASGNSGHSFAPHLHYQLIHGERVLDPYSSHQTYRRSIKSELKAGLDIEIARLDGLMATALAGN